MKIILMVILAVLTLASSTCFSEGAFSTLENQGSVDLPNPPPPPDNSWIFLYFPVGKYRFDTSLQLDQMSQSKVAPAENDHALELKALTLQFSLKW